MYFCQQPKYFCFLDNPRDPCSPEVFSESRGRGEDRDDRRSARRVVVGEEEEKKKFAGQEAESEQVQAGLERAAAAAAASSSGDDEAHARGWRQQPFAEPILSRVAEPHGRPVENRRQEGARRCCYIDGGATARSSARPGGRSRRRREPIDVG